MKTRKLDVLFISPGNSNGIYQDLSKNYSAIEPPTWALLLAQSMRSVGYEVNILDAAAEHLNSNDVCKRVNELLPKLICFVVYGQNVNAGTTAMSGALYLSKGLKDSSINIPIAFIGSHVQALPKQTLENESSIDFVFMNEGVYALRNLLKKQVIDINDLKDVKGIAWRFNGNIHLNDPEKVVPNELMDIDLPGYAWDLLPLKEKPLDLYRAPMWHSEYNEEFRTPYAAIQTSLGCQFGCSFCMINMINRNDNEEIGVASNYSGIRHWTPEFIIQEFDKLVELGVRTIKITDEMFLLNKKFYIPLCKLLVERGYGEILRMWAYSRIDTVRDLDTLKLVRSAGIKWLALGIESGDKKVRLEVSKGKFEEVDIQKVIKQVHEADIDVMANYIFGLPGDTLESMNSTLNLSIELCTSGWNGYPSMPLPGSALYKIATEQNMRLPKSYEGFSFHSYETIPLPTKYLTSEEILKFRDFAFEKYHTSKQFTDKIRNRFGEKAVNNINEMLKVKLKRRILEKNN